ncbi:MAG: methyltransferase domain-containing protein [Rikenellaceae bacterium]|nr:methyltransferase domain-containing protein [Rikenellaceae bacterium]
MNGKINKEEVRRRFNRSLARYDKLADVQREIAGVLSEKFLKISGASAGAVYEIGCGTGFLSSGIAGKILVHNYFINDLVSDALDIVEGKIRKLDNRIKIIKLCGDAEKTDIPADVNAVVAASVVQWFGDLQSFVKKAAEALPEGGILAFNTFGIDNLYQIRKLTGQGLDYLPVEELTVMLRQNFRNVEISEKKIIQKFKGPIDVLRHLKLTGVTVTGEFKWNKSRLADFERKYVEDYSSDGTVELTWHVVYAVCIK